MADRNPNDFRFKIAVDLPPALFDLIARFSPAQLLHVEAQMEKIKTALAKARKSLDKIKAKMADDAAAEAAEDEAAAALKADLEAQIAALQKRIDEETITPEEQAEFDTLVAELDELDGADEEPEPEPEPAPSPEPTPEPPAPEPEPAPPTPEPTPLPQEEE
jgi:hypothetical protein